MPPKKKKDSIPPEICQNLEQIDLHKYCPRKLFNIFFLNEEDEHSSEISREIIRISRNFQDISYVTFITYKEAMESIDKSENSPLPTGIKLLLLETCETLKPMVNQGETVPTALLARFMKLKLIEVMYQEYTNEVKKMKKRKALDESLNILSKECISAQTVGGKGSKKGNSKGGDSKSSKKGEAKKGPTKPSPEVVIPDYTAIAIDHQGEIVFDDDIYKQVSFYGFQGFYDPELLRELISVNNVPILAVIKIAADQDPSHTISDYAKYWEQLGRYFDGPDRLAELENTMLMCYFPSGNDYRILLEELLYVIKSTSDIKLQHLNYIRHLEIHEVHNAYSRFPLDCLDAYKKLLDGVPCELVHVPLLLNGLLMEVCSRMDGVQGTVSFSEISSRHSMLVENFNARCVSPCSNDVFFKKEAKLAREKMNVAKPVRSFLTYENDQLNIVLNSYRKRGRLVSDLTMDMMRNIKPLRELREFVSCSEETAHTHDIDPTREKAIVAAEDSGVVLHILYLLLFSDFDYKEIPAAFRETELTKNLQTYDKLEYIELSQVQIQDSASEYSDEEAEENLYNTPAVEYFWNEKLSTDVLVQEIFQAQQEFIYVKRKFSPETDNLLLQFYDDLDGFGSNVKVYEETLLTPVCLRDFCKFITVEKAQWLERNRPPKYAGRSQLIIEEECKGVTQVIERKMFQEYSYLLNTGSAAKEKETQENGQGVSLEFLLEELKNYPSNTGILEECGKSKNTAKFLAYDFGTNFFRIRGAQTTFHSHDDVKVSVDNTRFMDEGPKCTLTLSCRNNSLVVHSNAFYLKETFNFHVTLADGTVVSFALPNPDKRKSSVTPPEDDNTSTSSGEEETLPPKVEETELNEQAEDEGFTVLAVDKNYFENMIAEGAGETTQRPDDIFGSLKEAQDAKAPVYKITPNLTHLKRLRAAIEIPLTNIMRRILHKTIREKIYGSVTKKYEPKRRKSRGLPRKPSYDARIALPNGLYVTFYPSAIKRGLMEVKQEFLMQSLTPLEEFRLFTRAGYLLAKKIDGSITIFKSNGDAIDYEKMDGAAKKWRLRPCHCKNTNDYRKKVNKIMRRNYGDSSPVALSRRAGFRSRRGYVVDKDVFRMVEDYGVPYLKRTLLKFDGTRICLEGGKVTQKALLRITHERDFFAQEIYFERSDGFRSCLDRNGTQRVKFADGTKISSTPHVSRELVDGYVFISLDFQYEHPAYATVHYVFDDDLRVSFGTAVFRREADGDAISLVIDGDMVTTVNKEDVVFEKECSVCRSKYTCEINTGPLCKGEEIHFDEVFVHVQDTYNKHFYADFAGRCRRNGDYITGPFNAANCNHYKRMVYKKLFVVNRNFTGIRFLTDNMVASKKKAMETDENASVKISRDSNHDIETYKFRHEVFDHYCNRFLNKSLLEEQLCLPKYKRDRPKVLFYAVFSAMRRMTDLEGITRVLNSLLKYFEARGFDCRLLEILKKMSTESETCGARNNDSVRHIKVEVREARCQCEKAKIGISDKIGKWREERGKYKQRIRERDIPVYFSSEFCTVLSRAERFQ